jgi:hypothetical protein
MPPGGQPTCPTCGHHMWRAIVWPSIRQNAVSSAPRKIRGRSAEDHRGNHNLVSATSEDNFPSVICMYIYIYTCVCNRLLRCAILAPADQPAPSSLPLHISWVCLHIKMADDNMFTTAQKEFSPKVFPATEIHVQISFF